jgi:hypothetical protein
MGKKKRLYGAKLPVITRGKFIRLLLFVILTSLGFTLNRYVPAIQAFGWGFAFGMVCMAALTG